MEEIKKVYILINEREFTLEQVQSEIRDEGYEFEFFYDINSNLLIADIDEVWCFGNCSTFKEYEMFTRFGVEIWQMG